MSRSLILNKRAKAISFSLVHFLFLFSFSSILFFSSSCRLYKLEHELDPVNAEFISKVRYIITKKERKIFLELPQSEREKFKEEFWKRRDPNLDTEENEFKMEYFNRIEKANGLFLSEGKPGWMTDRGRIYILFGPPTDRMSQPFGGDSYRRCREIWYYGGFPVLFVDSFCTGNYQLVTYDLSPIRELNLMYMQELSLAQARAQKTFAREKRFFDFNWSLKKNLVKTDRVEGIIFIEIPYATIWYKAEDDRLKTTLDLHLELKDFENKLIWEYEEAFEIAMTEAELKERQNKMYKIEIPFILEEDLARLRQGKVMLHAVLKNRTGDEESKKVMEFPL